MHGKIPIWTQYQQSLVRCFRSSCSSSPLSSLFSSPRSRFSSIFSAISSVSLAKIYPQYIEDNGFGRPTRTDHPASRLAQSASGAAKFYSTHVLRRHCLRHRLFCRLRYYRHDRTWHIRSMVCRDPVDTRCIRDGGIALALKCR